MDIANILAELRLECERFGEAVLALQRLAVEEQSVEGGRRLGWQS
jgi:hypothetical protein